MPQKYAHGIAGNVNLDKAIARGTEVEAACGLRFVPTLRGKQVADRPSCPDCHPNRRQDLRPHFVYRCYDATGNLIYVGCSVAPIQRQDQHRATTWWYDQVASVRYIVFPDKEYALSKEREAIGEENPRWNIKGRNVDSFDLADFRDLHCAMAQNGQSGKRLEVVRAKALLKFGVDITRPIEASA